MNLHALAWFEIPVTDFERAKAFYSAIFDYAMPEVPMGGTRMGILPHLQQDGGIGGAIVQSAHHKVSGGTGVGVYLDASPDLNTVYNRIEAAGGIPVAGKTALPGMGFFALFTDTEGNFVGLWSKE